MIRNISSYFIAVALLALSTTPAAAAPEDLAWFFTMPSATIPVATAPTVDSDNNVYITAGNIIQAFAPVFAPTLIPAPTIAELKWFYEIPDLKVESSSSPVLSSNGAVVYWTVNFTGKHLSKVYAFDALDGTLRWSADMEASADEQLTLGRPTIHPKTGTLFINKFLRNSIDARQMLIKLSPNGHFATKKSGLLRKLPLGIADTKSELSWP